MREALVLKASDVVSNKSVVNVFRRDLKTTRFVVVVAIVGAAVVVVVAAIVVVVGVGVVVGVVVML